MSQQQQQPSSLPSSPPIVIPTTTNNNSSNTDSNNTPYISSFASSPSSTIGLPSTGSMTPSNINSSNNNTSTNNSNNNNSNNNNSNNNNNSFESILESWKLFNIDKKKNDFSDNVTQIGALKDDCLKSRKVLAKQTQDFKKLADDEKIKQLGSLLKLYQDEVDKLTKRSKFSETIFLGVYKDLNDLNDPVPALTAALEEYGRVDNTTKLEIENKKLQMQLDDFKKEFQEIQNQEVTIRRLEDKIKDYEHRFESTTLEKIQVREQELKQEFNEKLQQSKQKELSLQKRNDQLQEELTKLSISQNEIQNQLLDNKTKYEDELQSKLSEIEMLSTEFERVSNKLSTLQRENLSIREESVNEKNSLQPMVKRVADLELEMLQKETEISKLSDQISELKQQINIERDSTSSYSRLYEVEKEKVEKLDKYIQNNPSPVEFEKIKKELEALQAIVGQDEITQNNSANDSKLLKEKNRQLENELTRLRLSTSNLEIEVNEKNLAIEELQRIKDEQLSLIQRLEDDLSRGSGNGGNIINSNSGNAGTLVYQQSNPNSQNNLRSSSGDISDLLPNSPFNNNNNNNSSGSISSIINNNNNISSPLNISTSGSNTGKDDKMLEIVIGQRDRFKAKIDELGIEKSKLEKQLEVSHQEVQSLKNDNIKLYEKIRFLQSYDKSKSGSSGGSNNFNAKRSNNRDTYDIERGMDVSSSSNTGSNNGGPEAEERYGKLYEESINPFLSFNKKEKYRRYKEMNTAERVILNSSRFFLSNKYSRLFLFIYSILLHLMVFATLYRLATITTEQHYDNNGNIHVTPSLPNQKNINDLNSLKSSLDK